MNGRKALSLALAGIAVMSLAFGTGAFTSVSAERGVSVSVVDDDSAYVGYNTSNMTVSDGDRVELVTLQNRVNGDLEVTGVDIAADSTSFSDLSYPTMGSGQSGAIEGDVACDGGTTETIQVTVTVSGTGMWARIFGASETQKRAFNVTCEAQDNGENDVPISEAKFKGKGNFAVNDSAFGDTNITYWTYNDGNLNEKELDDFATGSNLQSQAPGNTGFVVVYFEEYNVSFIHPEFDVDNKSIDAWGSGWQSAVREDGNVLEDA